MSKFEVHIPAQEATGFNFTFRVDAENWMAALKVGLLKLGEQGSAGQNVLVDVQEDNSVHVTDSNSGRVFSIRELSEQESAKAQVKRSTRPVMAALPQPAAEPARRDTPIDLALQPPATPQATPREAKTIVEMQALPAVEPSAVKAPVEPVTRPVAIDPAAAPIEAQPVEAKPAPETKPTEISKPAEVSKPAEQSKPATKPSSKTKPPRAPSKVTMEGVVELERPTRPVTQSIGRPIEERRGFRDDIESTLADVFERVQNIYAHRGNDALYFLLDLALEKIPCEAGSVYRSDAGTGDLTFAAVRGAKADELLASKIVVPQGTGIVGFCTMEGVSVALSDVQKDPRFYAAVGEKVNFETKSVLCSPMMTHGRAFGGMQLINRKSAPQWGAHELGLLAYIAHQGALYLNALE